jgi:hypothetical protein
MTTNYRTTLIDGLWGRLARHGYRPRWERMFIVEALTHMLSLAGEWRDEQ